MKKIATLLLAAGLVFSAANSASAVEVKFSGSMDFAFEAYSNVDNAFESNSSYQHNRGGAPDTISQSRQGAVQRFRLGMDFIMSEALAAHYTMQVGTYTWGGDIGAAGNGGLYRDRGQGGQLAGGHASNLSSHLLYLDWMIPNTAAKVRMGLQSVALPGFTFGNSFLNDRGNGVVVTVPVNQNITLTPLWVRAAADYRRDAKDLGADLNYQGDLADIFALVANFKYDGWQVSPYAGYALKGEAVNTASVTGLNSGYGGLDHAKTWFGGLSGEMTMFDPFRFTADFFYGSTSAENEINERAGWYAMLGGEYKLPAYGVLGLKGWYASGDDDDVEDGSERAPSTDGGFAPTSSYYDGGFSIANNGPANANINGSWGVQMSWKQISFIEKLSHDLSVTYVNGTNDRAAIPDDSHPKGYLTKGDSFWEIDLNSTYKIYQNLAAVLELAYLIEDFNGETWGGDAVDGEARFNDMWRAALNFQYTF